MCAIDGADGQFEVYSGPARHKARKQYRCDECHRDIAAGEHYWRAFGVFDGRGASYFICEHCYVAASWLRDNCGGFLHDGVGEDISEHIREYPALALGLYRFKIGMNRKWKRFHGDGLMRVQPQAKSIESTTGAGP